MDRRAGDRPAAGAGSGRLEVGRDGPVRREATIPSIAIRYVLDRAAVAGVILGVRFGVCEHLDETRRVFDLGCADVSLADTFGAATPEGVARLLCVASDHLPPELVRWPNTAHSR